MIQRETERNNFFKLKQNDKNVTKVKKCEIKITRK